MQKKGWINFNITDVSRETFIKVEDKYIGKTLADLNDKDIKDIDNRRKLDYCQLMINYNETISLNNGLNILNINSILEFQYFIKDKFNFHVISTPCRKIITRKLTEEALKDYNHYWQYMAIKVINITYLWIV